MSKKEMVNRFGLEPRHHNCGCTIQYIRCNWDDDGKPASDLDFLRAQGIDVDGKVKEWAEKGDRIKQAQEAWKDKVRRENERLDQMYGKA